MTDQLINSKLIRGSAGILAIAAFSLLFLACSSVSAPILTTWEATLKPIVPHTIGGRGAALTQFGKTGASINIEDGEPGVSYGWRINSGTCQDSGSIQGGSASYPPLMTGEGGSATAEATLSNLFENGDHYAMRVFLPTGGGGEEIVACGELVQS